MIKKKTHPVLCAWCEKAGIETIIDYTTCKHSHGICPAHAAQLLAEIKDFAPDASLRGEAEGKP